MYVAPVEIFMPILKETGVLQKLSMEPMERTCTLDSEEHRRNLVISRSLVCFWQLVLGCLLTHPLRPCGLLFQNNLTKINTNFPTYFSFLGIDAVFCLRSLDNLLCHYGILPAMTAFSELSLA